MFEQWYTSIPPVTRTYVTAAVLTTIAVHLELVSTFDLYLNFRQVLHKHQYWRLVTNFLFFDHFGLNFLFHMFFLLRHSQALEEVSFRGKPADFVFMWIFGAVLLLALNWSLVFTNLLPRLSFLSSSLAFMAVYVWSRRNQHTRLNFLGLFNFDAPYLPYVIIGFGLMLGQNLVHDVLGIIVGHVYYWLADVYPAWPNGRQLLRTPGILKRLLDPVPLAGPQPGAAAANNNAHNAADAGPAPPAQQ